MTAITTKAQFEQIFKEHYNMLCNSVASVVGGGALAEDVVQEVMLHIWRNRRRIGQVKHMRAFLLRSCHNKAIEHLRKEASVKRLQEEVGHTPVIEDVKVDQAWLKERIFNSIRHLPPKCGEVFTMSKIEGLTYAEIAENLDISVKTVENHMSHALRLMRDMLRDTRHQ